MYGGHSPPWLWPVLLALRAGMPYPMTPFHLLMLGLLRQWLPTSRYGQCDSESEKGGEGDQEKHEKITVTTITISDREQADE